jgi:hypothetical protein
MASIFEQPTTDFVPIADTATDADSPNSAIMQDKIRIMLELLLIQLHGEFGRGTLTSDPPNDTTGYAYDTGAGFTTDEHNGRRLLFLNGNAAMQDFLIDDTVSGSRVVCTGDNLNAAGARSGDAYIITGNFRDSTVGHDHDGINSRIAVLEEGAVALDRLEYYTAGGYDEGSKSVTGSSSSGYQCTFIMPRGGTVTTRIQTTVYAGTSTFRVYVNTTATGTTRTDGGSWDQDISVSPGDLLRVYVNRSSGTYDLTFTILVSNPTIPA